jgi:hypothetical protein
MISYDKLCEIEKNVDHVGLHLHVQQATMVHPSEVELFADASGILCAALV